MNPKDIVETLNKAADRATSIAIASGTPLRLSKKSTLIANRFVEKNKNGFYDVLTSDRKKIYEDITVFDVAVIVAQRHSLGEISIIEKVLVLESKYAKHRNDMVHYLNCLKGAKSKNDIERMAILEDKFQVSELLARSTRDDISIFKRLK